jgi:endonuclease/exonuclease/phosphatase family metal-dependent hydrolase
VRPTLPDTGEKEGEPDVGEMVEIRVLTYNVRSLRDNRQTVAAVVRACEPDVVCVQEAPRFLRWRTKCAGLAASCGLVVLSGGRTAGDNLLLGSLRTRVRSTQDIKLTRTVSLRHWFYRRGVSSVVLEAAGATFAVVGTHLGLNERERARHIGEIFAHLDSLGVSHVILCGDLNEGPGHPVWKMVVDRFADAYAAAPWGDELTYPSRGPLHRIDAVFVSPGIEVVGCGVPQDVPGLEQASDHRPVLATLRVPVSASP